MAADAVGGVVALTHEQGPLFLILNGHIFTPAHNLHHTFSAGKLTAARGGHRKPCAFGRIIKTRAVIYVDSLATGKEYDLMRYHSGLIEF